MIPIIITPTFFLSVLHNSLSTTTNFVFNFAYVTVLLLLCNVLHIFCYIKHYLFIFYIFKKSVFMVLLHGLSSSSKKICFGLFQQPWKTVFLEEFKHRTLWTVYQLQLYVKKALLWISCFFISHLKLLLC